MAASLTPEQITIQYELLLKEVAQLKAEKISNTSSPNAGGSASLSNMVSDEFTDLEEIALEKWLKKTSRALSEAKVAKFEGTGWQSWERIIISDLTPIRMFSHLTVFQAPADIQALSQLEREKYVLTDLKLTNYLLVRLSVLPQRAVTSCKSAYLIWQKLKSLYASTSKVAQNKLKDEWERFVQLPGQTVLEFIQALEYLADSMESALVPRTDEDKLHRLLRGLSADWAGEKRYFELSSTSYLDACTMLQQLGEQQIEETNHRQIIPAFTVSTPRNQPRPNRSGSSRKPLCYTCGSADHHQDQCPTGLKPSKTEDGKFIPRCFSCLKEGHRSRECPTKNRQERSADWGKTAFHAQVEDRPGAKTAQEAGSATLA
jgi:hypothetical protein